MKNLIKKLFSVAIVVAAFSSCQKDEVKNYYLGGTAPSLSSNLTGTIPLTFATAANNAVIFKWTNPNYQFTSGISSQNVSYVLEIDTTGANFTNPNKQSVSISKDLSLTLIQSTLNDYLLNQLVLKPAVPHNIEMRVKSTLINNSAALTSNVLQFVVTPYVIPPKVIAPASGELYITGNALASDWTNAPPKTTQQFTKLSPTLFTITVALIGGNSYTFLPTYGSWNDKYSIANKNDPSEVFGGDFQWQGNDILAPAASGNYKIDVDFQRGKFTVTKQ